MSWFKVKSVKIVIDDRDTTSVEILMGHNILGSYEADPKQVPDYIIEGLKAWIRAD